LAGFVVNETRSQLIRNAADRAAHYLDSINDRVVAPSAGAVSALKHLAGQLPEAPTKPCDVLALLDEFASPATVANAGGRFFGFVNGGSVPAALAANVLAAAWDQNVGLRVMSPAAATLEDIVFNWIRELFNFPAECAGTLVTGATMANMTCLLAARHSLLAKAGWNVESLGLFGAPEFPVIVGDEVHASLLKAIAIAGLGRERVIRVPTDGQGRMRADAFPRLNQPSLICIQAGNVNTGAFDPAAEVCALARETGSWVHVDGAFGLWAVCAPRRAHLANGFNQAASWATDAHKWLNVPYDCGIAFVRDSDALYQALHLQAAYLPPGAERDPGQWTPESSRRARGVEVWAALRSLGRTGLADLIERTCRHAERFAAGLRAAGHEILNEVVINQVLVRFGDDHHTQRVIEAIQRDGTCWCGGTVWHGKRAMRISVSSWVTSERDVDISLAAILRIAAEQGEHDGSRN
jgi:glutamate/tyrosine decarboxylase-like PLP-dependent enzyme